MTNWFLRLVGKGKDPNDPAVRFRVGEAAGAVGVGCNLFLAALKLIAGIAVGSIAIIGDAVNNFSDAASSLLTLVGFRLAGKPADREHPYGHARMEYLVGLIVSVVVAMLGVEMLTSSVTSFADVSRALAAGETTLSGYSLPVLVIMGISAGVKLWMSCFNRALGKKIRSEALTAASVDSLGDAAATAAITVGMLLTPLTGPYTDSALGLAIAVYILCAGIRLIRETSSPILGEPPDENDLRKWRGMLLSQPGVLGIHDMVVHSYGRGRTFITVHIEVDAAQDILISHDRIDRIESEFEREFGIRLTVHMDPVCLNDEQQTELKEKLESILRRLSGEFGAEMHFHDFRMVRGTTHTNLIFDVVLPCDWRGSEDAVREAIAAAFRGENPSLCCVISFDRDYMDGKFQDT